MKLNTVLILIFFVSMNFSCTNDNSIFGPCSLANDPCKEVDDPLVELEWLSLEIQLIEGNDLSRYYYLSQAIYENRIVFYFGNCCPNCNSIRPVVYNCSGEEIGNLGEEIDPGELKDVKLIWKADDFACSIE